MVSFFRRYMSGEVGEDAIHDHIEAWHEGDYAEPLSAYLGLTDREYGAWVEDPFCLPQLVKERRVKDATQQPLPTSRRTTGGRLRPTRRARPGRVG
jgi:hypothetical protein